VILDEFFKKQKFWFLNEFFEKQKLWFLDDFFENRNCGLQGNFRNRVNIDWKINYLKICK
jgi:hypothetical protein